MRRFEGYTLIEMMVCFALTSLIFSTLWLVYQNTVVHATTGIAVLDVHRSLGLLVGAVRSDLRAATGPVEIGPGSLRVTRAMAGVSIEIRYALDGAAGIVVRTAPGAIRRKYGTNADGWLVARFEVEPVRSLPDTYKARVEARRRTGTQPVVFDALVQRRVEIATPRDLRWHVAYE